MLYAGYSLKKCFVQVPIYRGAKSAIVKTPPVTDYFGKDGLGDVDGVHTDLHPPKEQGAVSALIELSKTYEGCMNKS